MASLCPPLSEMASLAGPVGCAHGRGKDLLPGTTSKGTLRPFTGPLTGPVTEAACGQPELPKGNFWSCVGLCRPDTKAGAISVWVVMPASVLYTPFFLGDSAISQLREMLLFAGGLPRSIF
jgi:hypothetical protein